MGMKGLVRQSTYGFFLQRIAAPVITAVLGLIACGGPAWAQSGAGSIQGTVTDPSGAVIPGALIHVVNNATSVASDTKSNGVGFYQVPELFTGTYTVTITAPGMKTYRTAVELLVAQNAVVNAVLSAGAVTQQVEVSAEMVQLTTTDSGTIASTLESNRIDQLPMNGRLLLTLTGETTPGLESSGSRANGLMAEALEYVADGVTLADRQFGGSSKTLAELPDPDTVQEVRVETTNTSAMYSEPATAIITTKSGTNSLHGAAFETMRNNAVGIARSRSNPSNYAAPHLVRNEFGASAGGPIIIPHLYHGKDKSFWFFAYEKYSLASSSNELVSVPTTAMRQGNFTGLTNSSDVPQFLMDPATTTNSASCYNPYTATSAPNPYCRTQFDYNGVANTINPARLSPTSKIIYDITALPGTSQNPVTSTNLSAPDINNEFVPQYTFRFDHEFNEKNRAYLRFTQSAQTQLTLRNYPFNSPATIAADGFPNAASGETFIPSDTFAVAVSYTHVFSPTFFAETVVSQQWFSQHNLAGGTPLADFESKLGLPNNFGEGGFPNYGANLICPYGGTQFIYGLTQIVDTADENLTKTIGKNQMQFGGRYRHERFGDIPDELADTVGFGLGSSPSTGVGQATALYNPATGASYGTYSNTGFPDGDMYIGAASSFAVNLEPPYAHYHDMEFDAYFQDNYRWTRSLTLNIGLRYEAHPAPWTKDGAMESFDLKNDAMVLAVPPATLIQEGYTTQTIINNILNLGGKIETAQEAGYPATTLIENKMFNVSPRVGIAYQLFGGRHGTVLRGAYGRYIYPVPTRSTLKNIQQDSPFTATYSTNYDSASQSPDGLPNYMVRGQPNVTGTNTTNAVNSSTATSIPPGIALFSLNPDQPPDFVTQVNFTVEQALKGNSALRLTWLWSHGTNLDQEYYFNATPSQYVWEIKTGTLQPTGPLSAVATNPYDSVIWGNSSISTAGQSSGSIWDQKSGWSNDNALQVNYQRLFHRGIAYQISYVWSKPFRLGGNYFRDGYMDTMQDYANSGLGTLSEVPGSVSIVTPNLGPARPAGIAPYAYWHGMDRYQNYIVDTAIPKQHITFNGIVDLPVGRGKRFLGNANRLVDELVGGFQIAGDGSVISQDFALDQPTSSTTPTPHWGATNPLNIYKHQKITDCRSGTCLPAYLWFNGYISPTVINAAAKGVSNLPSGYQNNSPTSPAFISPIDNTPGTANFGTDNVNVTLLNGTTVTTTYAPGIVGANPYSHTVLNGPMNYEIDLSLFKVFPIKENINFRVNLDAFNALNIQGYTNPNSLTGIEEIAPGGVGASSYWTPRQLQLTMRLTF
jgi:hypothetical protein